MVEQNAAPYTNIVAKDEQLTPTWKEYSLSWVQTSDTPGNWAKADFQVGQQAGTTEITGVTIRKME